MHPLRSKATLAAGTVKRTFTPSGAIYIAYEFVTEFHRFRPKRPPWSYSLR